MSPIRVWYADGPNSPRTSPRDAVVAAGLEPDAPLAVTLGWTIEPHPWLDEGGPATGVTIRTVLAGYGLSGPVADGRVTALPVRLSAVPGRIAADPPDVAVVTGIRRGDQVAFSTAVGWGDVLARTAARVVVEIDPAAPDLGAPLVEGAIVAVLERPPSPARPAGARTADAVDLEIGATVASLLPPHPTLQFGPGGIAEGIARSITSPVSIWSGLLTDAMAELHDRDLLLAPAVAAYTWGGPPVARLAAAGMLRLASSTVTHDLSTISSIPRFVGCNTALQVGLDGSVNVERVGGRIVAAVGGHADFSVGAARSPGGCSIVALRATTRAGGSTIVPHVDVVSTARSDVDVVVTEHGVAVLRDASDAERTRRLIAVAAPEHRDDLRRGRGGTPDSG